MCEARRAQCHLCHRGRVTEGRERWSVRRRGLWEGWGGGGGGRVMSKETRRRGEREKRVTRGKEEEERKEEKGGEEKEKHVRSEGEK